MIVSALRIGGKPETWRELGFEVDGRGVARLGDVRIELRDDIAGEIASWALDHGEIPADIDGLPTDRAPRSGEGSTHPNGAGRIDHVVVLTPSLERTSAAFARVGIECRRTREAGGGARQGFFLVGDLLLEVVDPGKGVDDDAPARFWGITVEVADLDAAAALLGERLGAVKDAVQPGRRIATVRKGAAEGLPLALITQRERSSG